MTVLVKVGHERLKCILESHGAETAATLGGRNGPAGMGQDWQADYSAKLEPILEDMKKLEKSAIPPNSQRCDEWAPYGSKTSELFR